MASAQKEQVLMYELTIAVASDEKPTAITSCNYHQDHFGHTFDIQRPKASSPTPLASAMAWSGSRWRCS